MNTLRNEQTQTPRALTTSAVDFWLIGGCTFVVCAVSILVLLLRDRVPAISGSWNQGASLFYWLSILLFYPHFYFVAKIAYGRGTAFILKNWLCLIFVPLIIIASFVVAFFTFNQPVPQWGIVTALNGLFSSIGIGFQIGRLPDLGTEIVSANLLLMHVTVIWHYTMQAFGCMVVFAHFNRYPVARKQRNLIKASVLSLGIMTFLLVRNNIPADAAFAVKSGRFIYGPHLGLPSFLLPLSIVAAVVTFFGVLIGVVYRNYMAGHAPRMNFLMPWLVLYIWWIPGLIDPVFFYAAVPILHAIQYLPFVYRMDYQPMKKYGGWLIGYFALIVGGGYLLFETIPFLLNSQAHRFGVPEWFFFNAIVIFLNVHHIFVDSVNWKFDQKEVRERILEIRDSPSPAIN